MATLPETVTAGSSSHFAHHSELRTAFVGRGGTSAIPDLTSASTAADHRQVHQLLHAEHNGRTGQALPTVLTDVSTGHLAHHGALHVAHNALQAVTPPAPAPVATDPIATSAPAFPAGSSYYSVDPARTTL